MLTQKLHHPRTPSKKALRQRNSMKGISLKRPKFPLPQRKVLREQVSCPKLDRTLERFGQCGGVEGWEYGRQVCLLGFSHTMIRSNCRRRQRLSRSGTRAILFDETNGAKANLNTASEDPTADPASPYLRTCRLTEADVRVESRPGRRKIAPPRRQSWLTASPWRAGFPAASPH
jgi:hypothetical protein